MTDAFRTSIERLVRRYELPADAAKKLRTLLELLARDPAAPTAVREPARIAEEHLADALVALELEFVRDAAAIADLGSGAGLPGLPLAIARPTAAISLVESSARKCSFLARAVAACDLPNVAVVNVRAEAWPDGLDRFDLVTARALAPLAVVLEYAAPLLNVGGRLVAWRGHRDADAEAAASAAAVQLEMQAVQVRPVAPYPGSHSRHLHVFSKAGPTPAGFPRRPGIARKRPLARSAAPT
jgi:16S rRNA (guanine527-N7)-methyltransferase